MTKTSEDNLSITELPYSERQLLLVSDDEVVNIARKAQQEIMKEKQGIDWYKIGEADARSLMPPFGNIITDIAKESMKSWIKARESGLKIISVPRSQINLFRFPPG